MNKFIVLFMRFWIIKTVVEKFNSNEHNFANAIKIFTPYIKIKWRFNLKVSILV